jgi:hypothetical protein
MKITITDGNKKFTKEVKSVEKGWDLVTDINCNIGYYTIDDKIIGLCDGDDNILTDEDGNGDYAGTTWRFEL